MGDGIPGPLGGEGTHAYRPRCNRPRPTPPRDKRFPRREPAPLLVLVDMQREYVEEGRPLYLRDIGDSLARCKRLLDTARQRHWDVAHIFWRRSGPMFNPKTPYWEAIDGFHARATSERVFFKAEPSAYSNELFARMMEERQPAMTYLAGYQGTLACLCTLVDAHDRRHNMAFVGDGSHSAATEAGGEMQTHRTLIEIVRQFGEVISASDLLDGDTGDDLPARNDDMGAWEVLTARAS